MQVQKSKEFDTKSSNSPCEEGAYACRRVQNTERIYPHILQPYSGLSTAVAGKLVSSGKVQRHLQSTSKLSALIKLTCNGQKVP
jgi:hypothetical protein